MPENTNCPIWGTPTKMISSPHSVDMISIDSPRAGGKYLISITAEGMLESRDDRLKAKLTSWLVEQRWLGQQKPEVMSTTIKNANQRRNLSVHERAGRILRYIDEQTARIGDSVRLSPSREHPSQYYYMLNLLAISESTKIEEVVYLLDYLNSLGWLHKSADGWQFVLTVDGYTRLAELDTKYINSSRAFVAMWLDSSVNQLLEEGIEPGIKDAGYDPIRIDKTEPLDKIDDAIIAEIRRSRFIVADFTHGDKGVRGSVYYEAGFAHGMNIPVIFLCRKDMIDKIHFDTRQHKHIEWEKEKLGEFREKLANRISAVIGDGPLKNEN